MTEIMVELGLPMSWVTPSGMVITPKYSKSKQISMPMRFGGRTQKMVIREWTKQVDKKKQVEGIIPNIIHSLDANHLINIINSSEVNKGTPIISVHDCFGTLPSKMGNLEHTVKKEFILLYTDYKFLELFHNRILQSIIDNNYEIFEKDENKFIILTEKNKKLIARLTKNTKKTSNLKVFVISKSDNLETVLDIPNIPKIGKLDLEKIINSKYMIN